MSTRKDFEKELEENRIFKYVVPIDELKKAQSLYDIFNYIVNELDLDDTSLTKFEKEMKNGYKYMSKYSFGPGKIPITDEEKQKMRDMINKTIAKLENQPEFKNGISFNEFLSSVHEPFDNFDGYRYGHHRYHHRRYLDDGYGSSYNNIIMIIIALVIVGAIGLYMYRDKLFKK